MSAQLPSPQRRFTRYLDSGYPLTIRILVTLLLMILPISAASDAAAHSSLPWWRPVSLAALVLVSLLVVHTVRITQRRKWQQVCCLALQCGLIGAMQAIVPSTMMGYLYLSTVLQAVYLFGIVFAVVFAIPVWAVWSGSAIAVTSNWLAWIGSNIYAVFLIVAVTLAAAVYTSQHHLKTQIDNLLQRLQSQCIQTATPEQIQQAATLEERHRLMQTISDELRSALGRLEQTVGGAIVQAQDSIAQTQPLLLQTQIYVRETADSLRATLRTLRPVTDTSEDRSSATLRIDTPLTESVTLLGTPLVAPGIRRVLEWLPLAFSCFVPLWIFFDQRLAPLASSEMIVLWLSLVGCYLYTRWRWSTPWFQLGLAGQACTLLLIVLVSQSSALLIGLAIIAGQLALRCNWVQLVAGLVVLQGAVGVAVSLINLAPWQIVASLLLVGTVATALVFPIVSARRRFGQRSVAATLLQELSEEVATLNVQANDLRQAAMVAERQRLAREIHDGLGHYLMTIALQIRVAQDLLSDDPETALRQLLATQSLISEAQQQLAASFDALHPLSLTGGSLSEALDTLAQQHNQRGEGSVCLQREGPLNDIPDEVALALFRAVQEGLSNAVRHGQATHVAITLTRWPGLVRLLVEDNGIGCKLPTQSGGMGLQGLRERAALLGGVCEVVSQTGSNFTLLFEVPLTWTQP